MQPPVEEPPPAHSVPRPPPWRPPVEEPSPVEEQPPAHSVPRPPPWRPPVEEPSPVEEPPPAHSVPRPPPWRSPVEEPPPVAEPPPRRPPTRPPIGPPVAEPPPMRSPTRPPQRPPTRPPTDADFQAAGLFMRPDGLAACCIPMCVNPASHQCEMAPKRCGAHCTFGPTGDCERHRERGRMLATTIRGERAGRRAGGVFHRDRW
jgi:hypothetical protein